MNYDLTLIGDRIKQLRKNAELTQAQLAEKVDLSTTYLNQIENGVRGVNLANLIAIANCFNVTLDYLATDFTFDSQQSEQDLDKQWMQLFEGKSPSAKQKLIDLVRDMLKHITT